MNAESLLEESNKLRNKYPFNDPIEIAKQENIRVYYKEIGTVPGLFTYISSLPIIIVNSNLDDISVKTIVAHELGHFVLHKKLLKKNALLETGLFDFKEDILTEYEANAFAAHLLIDTNKLLDLACNYDYDYEALCSEFGCASNLLFIKIRELQKLGFALNLPAVPDSKFLKKYRKA